MGMGDDNQLMKVAVFCIAFSIISTCMASMFILGQGDYDYDTISAYKSELTEFSGGQLVNDTPWVLTGVYTPFVPGMVPDSEIEDHIEYDNGRTTGWLFGEKITNYTGIGEVVDIKLDPDKKSNQLLTVGNPYDWSYETGKEWWAGDNPYGIDLSPVGKWGIQTWHYITENELYTDTSGYGVQYSFGTANNWAYTGYRYVFDPVLPLSSQGSVVDGRLSIVWYDIVTDTGLSGALEIYSDANHEQVLLGRISATDILSAFQSTTGYSSVFDFDFEGTTLNLVIRFSPTVYNTYNSLKAAWDAGEWSLAIASPSAGNFFDVEHSNAFSITAGSAFDTFIDIFTFQTPEFTNDPWVSVIMWLMCGLPMTLGMLCVTMRLVGGVFKIF